MWSNLICPSHGSAATSLAQDEHHEHSETFHEVYPPLRMTSLIECDKLDMQASFRDWLLSGIRLLHTLLYSTPFTIQHLNLLPSH